jgi:hypothetical protein
MTDAEFNALEQGDGLIVGFGRQGSQLATVLGWTAAGSLYVAKWRRASKKWTGRVRLGQDEIRTRSREFQHHGLPVGAIPELRRGLLRKKPHPNAGKTNSRSWGAVVPR